MGILVKFGELVFWWLKKAATNSPTCPPLRGCRREHQIPTKVFNLLA